VTFSGRFLPLDDPSARSSNAVTHHGGNTPACSATGAGNSPACFPFAAPVSRPFLGDHRGTFQSVCRRAAVKREGPSAQASPGYHLPCPNGGSRPGAKASRRRRISLSLVHASAARPRRCSFGRFESSIETKVRSPPIVIRTSPAGPVPLDPCGQARRGAVHASSEEGVSDTRMLGDPLDRPCRAESTSGILATPESARVAECGGRGGGMWSRPQQPGGRLGDPAIAGQRNSHQA